MALDYRKLDEIYQLVLQLPAAEQQILAKRLLQKEAVAKPKKAQKVLQAAGLLAPWPEIVVEATVPPHRTKVVASSPPLCEIVIAERR